MADISIPQLKAQLAEAKIFLDEAYDAASRSAIDQLEGMIKSLERQIAVAEGIQASIRRQAQERAAVEAAAWREQERQALIQEIAALLEKTPGIDAAVDALCKAQVDTKAALATLGRRLAALGITFDVGSMVHTVDTQLVDRLATRGFNTPRGTVHRDPPSPDETITLWARARLNNLEKLAQSSAPQAIE